MKKLQLFFKKTVTTIEDYPLSLKRYFLLFLAILSLRLTLEFFANQRLFRSDDVLHIGLWFLFIVEAFMLQLHLFSKVRVEKIVKLVICCFSIALTAPLIDLLVSQGKFSKMNYLSIHSFSDIAWSYITIGGASLNRGATIGIRIEIVLLVIASFNYVWIKTGKLWRALIGTLSIYTVLFLSGTIPYFMGKLNDVFQLRYGPDDQSSSYLLFTIDIFLFLILVFRSNRNIIPWKWNNLFLFRMTAALSMLVFGAYLARVHYPTNWMLDPTTLYFFPLLAVIVVLLIASESHALFSKNDLNDTHLTQNGILVMLMSTSACISFYTLFAVMLTWSMYFFLYQQPLRFFRIRFLSEILQAGLMCGYLFIGYLSFGAPMIGMEKNVIFSTLIISFSSFLMIHYINPYIYKK